ncbi:hypothetical protein IJM86_00090 [bacterium]|nr:hypothetical protein [bacterium]
MEDSALLEQLAYYKDWIFIHDINDLELCDDRFMKDLIKAYKLIYPVLEFFEEAYDREDF